METTYVPLGERLIALSICRHARARRISLRLSPARDGIVMTLPKRAALAKGMAFFASKSQWVLSHVEQTPAAKLAEGAVISLLGNETFIKRGDGRGVATLHDNILTIYGAPEFTERRVRDFLKKHLQSICLEQARTMAGILGKTIREVKIRDTRSRWGSCTASGILTFNWRLVLAPPEILNYLIAHEVAHLAEMNHSRTFWEVVARLHPDYKKSRLWLKNHGHTLHRHD